MLYGPVPRKKLHHSNRFSAPFGFSSVLAFGATFTIEFLIKRSRLPTKAHGERAAPLL
jgi:hypothetical protein